MSTAMAGDAGRPAEGRMGGDQAGSGVIKVLRGQQPRKFTGPERKKERAE